MSDVMIRAAGVHKYFGSLHVLKGIDLEVHRGEKVVIIGPSGSGKSTLLRCMNYLEQPDQGGIEVDGQHFRRSNEGPTARIPAEHLSRMRQQIGMVFQRFNLFGNKTALGNVVAALVTVKRLDPGAARQVAERYLQKVGLSDKLNAYPLQLSGGQQQRVAIARALAMEPKVMLFDEATSALDPELVGEVLGVIRQLADEGTTMVLVTHEMRFAREVADRIVFMDHGQVVEQGHPARLFSNPSHPRTRAFLDNYLPSNDQLFSNASH